jgi:hypothetical protein
VAGTDARDLHALAEELLQACVDALDTLPALNLLGAPERSFVSFTEPAADCCDPGQLTVHVPTVGEGATEPGGLQAGRRFIRSRINHPVLVVTLFRCVPVSRDMPPDADSLEAAAVQLNADGWALWNHTYNAMRAGELFSTCIEVFNDGLRALPASGACAGWILPFRVTLDGYEEVFV